MAIAQNTLYLTPPGTVVHRDHLTLRVEIEKQTRLTVPILHLESICAFGQVVVTPPAMALCWDHQVAVHYHTENGYLLAQVLGSGDTRYLLRRAQYAAADSPQEASRIARQFVAGKHPGYQILVQYRVIRLSQIPGQAVLDRGTVGLLPFAPLMQPPAGQAEEAWLEQCIARAAALPLGQSVKADVLAGLAILSGLVYNPQTITAIVSKEHLMDLMRESSFAQYLAETIREEIIEEGTKQGIEQGIEQGIQEVLALEDMHPLARRIEAIDDVQRLKQLHRAGPALKPLGTC